jgi:hypothetical protein
MKTYTGAALAAVLLGLYTYAVYVTVVLALGPGGAPNSGILLCLTTIGGLVSALVIAVLAITNPGERLGAQALARFDKVPDREMLAVTVISIAYIVAWTLTGLAAFVVGVMLYPDKVQALTNLGQSWLGLAVAAAYSYFGLSRT